MVTDQWALNWKAYLKYNRNYLTALVLTIKGAFRCIGPGKGPTFWVIMPRWKMYFADFGANQVPHGPKCPHFSFCSANQAKNLKFAPGDKSTVSKWGRGAKLERCWKSYIPSKNWDEFHTLSSSWSIEYFSFTFAVFCVLEGSIAEKCFI